MNATTIRPDDLYSVGNTTESVSLSLSTTNFPDDYYPDYYPDDFPEICNYGRPGAAFLPAFYSILILVGVTGNALVVWVLAAGTRLRSMTDVCLLNLAAADLLLLSTLPFLAHQAHRHWSFGDVVCKVVLGAYHVGFYASIFFLVLMSVDRYLAIVHAISSTGPLCDSTHLGTNGHPRVYH